MLKTTNRIVLITLCMATMLLTGCTEESDTEQVTGSVTEESSVMAETETEYESGEVLYGGGSESFEKLEEPITEATADEGAASVVGNTLPEIGGTESVRVYISFLESEKDTYSLEQQVERLKELYPEENSLKVKRMDTTGYAVVLQLSAAEYELLGKATNIQSVLINGEAELH